MDNQNTMNMPEDIIMLIVLILVLMDNQNTTAHLIRFALRKRLNPCSNG